MRLWLVAFACCLVACSDDRVEPVGQGGGGGATTQASVGGGGTGGSSAVGGGGQGGAGGDPLPQSDVHLIGRYDETGPAPRSTWSGSAARTRIDGTSVSVRLAGSNDVYFEIVIDGVSTGRFRTDGGELLYPLASGLVAGEHDVTIVRRNEGFFGVTEFLGFETPGAIVPTPFPYAHRLEFIGDSLTCGYGIEGPNATCNFSGDTESAFSSYASVAARAVDAAAHLVCFSGKGVHQNYGGDTTEPMPLLYGRTLTEDGMSAWDFARFAPDAVVINLGTNDFSAPLDNAAFIADYVALMATVRSHHDNARIYAVTWAHWGASDEALVGEAVNQSGDANAATVRFSIDPADGLGCDYHTNVVTNQKLGVLLADTLRADLGW